MSETAEPRKSSNVRVGLCADCVHMRQIQSDRGSVFYMCQLSASDARFPKYPRLPVVRCSGYERSQSTDAGDDSGT